MKPSLLIQWIEALTRQHGSEQTPPTPTPQACPKGLQFLTCPQGLVRIQPAGPKCVVKGPKRAVGSRRLSTPQVHASGHHGVHLGVSYPGTAPSIHRVAAVYALAELAQASWLAAWLLWGVHTCPTVTRHGMSARLVRRHAVSRRPGQLGLEGRPVPATATAALYVVDLCCWRMLVMPTPHARCRCIREEMLVHTVTVLYSGPHPTWMVMTDGHKRVLACMHPQTHGKYHRPAQQCRMCCTIPVAERAQLQTN